jgi:LCP family protein required for cell wall assembly
MYAGRIVPVLVALAVATVTWAVLDRVRARARRRHALTGQGEPHGPGGNQSDTAQIDSSVIRQYGEMDAGAEGLGLVEPADTHATPPRRRFGRPLALFLLMLLSLTAGGLYVSTSVISRVDNVLSPTFEFSLPRPVTDVLPGLDTKPVEGGPGTRRINILVLGVDRRPHHDVSADGPPNTDSIHLLSLDPVSRTASAVAIPRDLYVEAPDPVKKGAFTELRINTAYRRGIEAEYPGGGPAFAKRVIEYTFQMPIDYYVVMDWLAFADVIDAMQGVWITVPETLRDVEAINPRDGNAFKITIPAGTHYMDAITVLAYARYRGDEQSDFGRIKRQQQVMHAAADEALRRGWLKSGPQLYNRFRDAVETDLSNAKLPGMLKLVSDIGLDNAKLVSAAGDDHEAVTGVITPWGEDVLIPNWETMSAIVRDAIEDRALATEGATVSVVNASGVRGQGDRTVAYLRRFQLPPDRITIADAPPTTASPTASSGPGAVNASGPGTASARAVEQTSITYTGEAQATAERIARWLGLPESRIARIESSFGAPAAVTVQLGTDVRLPDDLRFRQYRLR